MMNIIKVKIESQCIELMKTSKSIGKASKIDVTVLIMCGVKFGWRER